MTDIDKPKRDNLKVWLIILTIISILFLPVVVYIFILYWDLWAGVDYIIGFMGIFSQPILLLYSWKYWKVGRLKLSLVLSIIQCIVSLTMFLILGGIFYVFVVVRPM